eukprot:TRINITY_DN87498_c0_g1_i1.p1 TRINITY_DN87498_c0_g1~~TRINITY_DN87498_c0_g1_i1.p1  ORF type:complete len:817 (-),score=130.92 TRINITY_DN87498_c0_g1_i1:74-2524(-)
MEQETLDDALCESVKSTPWNSDSEKEAIPEVSCILVDGKFAVPGSLSASIRRDLDDDGELGLAMSEADTGKPSVLEASGATLENASSGADDSHRETASSNILFSGRPSVEAVKEIEMASPKSTGTEFVNSSICDSSAVKINSSFTDSGQPVEVLKQAELESPTSHTAATAEFGTDVIQAVEGPALLPELPEEPSADNASSLAAWCSRNTSEGSAGSSLPFSKQVTLECIRSSTQPDLSNLAPEACRLILAAGTGPWLIGRQAQPQFFTRLVPDEAVRNYISRNHFELSWNKSKQLVLKQLSPNALSLDGEGLSASTAERNVQHGSEISFCMPGVELPFLVLRLLFQDQGSAKSAKVVPRPAENCSPQEALFRAPHESASSDREEPAPNSFALVCTKLRGCIAADLPPEIRSSAIRLEGGRFFVGRQHQVGFFEGLLGRDHPLLSYISRAHFQVCVAGPGLWEVTNLSSNPITVGQHQLSHGGSAVVALPFEVGFLANFEVPSVKVSPSPEIFLQLRIHLQVAVDRPVAIKSGHASYALELGGSAVKSNLAVERLRLPVPCPLPGSASVLTVGRMQQPELHQEALSDVALQWVSREHFRLEVSTSGSGTEQLVFALTPLSSNPMWLQRGADCTKVSRGCCAVPLVVGDRILLFTGARDGSHAGLGNCGSLFWNLVAVSTSSNEFVPRPRRASEMPAASPALAAGVMPAGQMPRARRATTATCHASMDPGTVAMPHVRSVSPIQAKLAPRLGQAPVAPTANAQIGGGACIQQIPQGVLAYPQAATCHQISAVGSYAMVSPMQMPVVSPRQAQTKRPGA